jgi:methylene-tetrahydromethanopterin dehydrogenase
MADKHILHMVTPLKHMSPFDVNMAVDAGFDIVTTYTAVQPEEVAGLVQDAIFSRPPQDGVKTGFFFAGKDAVMALDMLDRARMAMVPPFEVSLFADPAGSFTTAAAMVACVERTLQKLGHALMGSKIAIFGATGVVGFSAAVIAALEGAQVVLAGYDGPARVEKASGEIRKRFEAETEFADASSEGKKSSILKESDVALSAGRAGVRIIDSGMLRDASRLKVVADVNAVPPAGVEGLDVTGNDQQLPGSGAVGIGPLTIGNIKYQTESGLFKQMITAKKPVAYDFRDAFALARQLVS